MQLKRHVLRYAKYTDCMAGISNPNRVDSNSASGLAMLFTCACVNWRVCTNVALAELAMSLLSSASACISTSGAFSVEPLNSGPCCFRAMRLVSASPAPVLASVFALCAPVTGVHSLATYVLCVLSSIY